MRRIALNGEQSKDQFFPQTMVARDTSGGAMEGEKKQDPNATSGRG